MSLTVSIDIELKNAFAAPMRKSDFLYAVDKLAADSPTTTSKAIHHHVLTQGIVSPTALTAQNGDTITIYSASPLGQLDPYALAQAMVPRGFFCHLSAIFQHGLTQQVPRTIYICDPSLTPARKRATLSDSAIRRSFLSPHRQTKLRFNAGVHEVVIVKQATDLDHGVVRHNTRQGPLPSGCRVTCLERALIDAVVRPHYNGGILSVAAHIKAAGKKIKVDRLQKIYAGLNYLYPYHQAIGFLFTLAGQDKLAARWHELHPPTASFFIDHNAKASWAFDETWRIHYPPSLRDGH